MASSSPRARGARTTTAIPGRAARAARKATSPFFYDHYGYERYDFVVQLDADHVPDPDYLFQMLRPFADPAVGYVSAPSICDRNAHESWSARGRLYAEASMHGSLQAGYNNGLGPALHRVALCGSHGGIEGNRRPWTGTGGRSFHHL